MLQYYYPHCWDPMPLLLPFTVQCHLGANDRLWTREQEAIGIYIQGIFPLWFLSRFHTSQGTTGTLAPLRHSSLKCLLVVQENFLGLCLGAGLGNTGH